MAAHPRCDHCAADSVSDRARAACEGARGATHDSARARAATMAWVEPPAAWYGLCTEQDRTGHAPAPTAVDRALRAYALVAGPGPVFGAIEQVHAVQQARLVRSAARRARCRRGCSERAPGIPAAGVGCAENVVSA